MAMVRDTVQLNDTERELFATLLAATRHAQAKTTMRCAGGWVRDKLLGRDSADIDIALDDMLGGCRGAPVCTRPRPRGACDRSRRLAAAYPEEAQQGLLPVRLKAPQSPRRAWLPRS